jgi:hypothetical protein
MWTAVWGLPGETFKKAVKIACMFVDDIKGKEVHI